MPYDEPDPTDPTLLIGVEVPADADSDLEMAYAFAEEFACLGFTEDRLLSLFHEPFYAGAHRALRSLGEEKIGCIIREALQVWASFRFVVHDVPEGIDVPLDRLQAANPSEE
jgi:hypothetical protein